MAMSIGQVFILGERIIIIESTITVNRLFLLVTRLLGETAASFLRSLRWLLHFLQDSPR